MIKGYKHKPDKIQEQTELTTEAPKKIYHCVTIEEQNENGLECVQVLRKNVSHPFPPQEDVF